MSYNTLRTIGLGTLFYAAATASGCASPLPKLGVDAQRARVEAGDFTSARKAEMRNIIGSYERDGKRILVAANGGLEEELNESRNDSKRWQPQAGDIELEWTRQPVEDTYAHSLTAYVVRGTQDKLELKKFLDYQWTAGNDDLCTITTYNTQTGNVEKTATAPLERGVEQARFYTAAGVTDVRRLDMPLRVGRILWRQTAGGLLEMLPGISVAYRDSHPFEFGEADNVGGWPGWLGQYETRPAYQPLSWLGDALRAVVLRPIINGIRGIDSGLEERKADGRLDFADYVLLGFVSLFETADNAIAGFFGVDKDITDLFTDNDTLGDEKPWDDQVEGAVKVVKRAALAALQHGGGSGSGALGSNGGSTGIGGGNSFSDGVAGAP